jgi:tetratricopeptide (TPR) repeat protein
MKTALFSLVPFLLFGCATLSEPEPSGALPVHGLVYDYGNLPVPSAVVRVDGKRSAVSDANGRFVSPPIPPGVYDIGIERDGYEPKRVRLEYSRPNQILYAKLYSAEQLLSLAEKSLGKRDWDSAAAFLERALAVRPDDLSARYLRSVLLFRKGEPEAAREALDGLLREGARDPFIHLFLADLLQFRLGNAEEALEHLDRFLASRYDPDVDARRAALAEGVRR